jgi:hypothetical protein
MDLLNPHEQTLRFVRSGWNLIAFFALVDALEELKASLRLYMLYFTELATLKPANVLQR